MSLSHFAKADHSSEVRRISGSSTSGDSRSRFASEIWMRPVGVNPRTGLDRMEGSRIDAFSNIRFMKDSFDVWDPGPDSCRPRS